VKISGAGPAVVPVVAAGNNRVFAIWTDVVQSGEVYFAMSIDGGITWGAPVRVSNAANYSRPSGAMVDSAGNMHVAWFDGRGGYGQLYHRMYCPANGIWTPEQWITQFDSASDAESPRLAQGADGTVYLLYRGDRDGSPQQGWPPFDHYMLRGAVTPTPCAAPMTWKFPSQRVTRGLPEEFGNTYAGQIYTNPAGTRLNIAYWNEANGNNLLFRRGDPKGAGFGPVANVSQFGPNHLEFDGTTADVGGFGLGEDTLGAIHALFAEFDHVREGFQVGRVLYARSSDGVTFGAKLQASTSAESMQPQAIYHNGKFHMIWADFRDNNSGAEIYYRNTTADVAPAPVFLSTTTQSFPTTTINTSSGGQAITITNTTASTVSGINIAVSGAFTQTNNCGASLAPGATCTVTVTFAPTVAGSNAGTLSIAYTGTGSPATVALSGFASAFDLVDHYYQSILGRAADASGRQYWHDEAARMQANGVDVKEAYMVMAGYFFNSAEYLGLNTTNSRFVTDLYNTFLNRAPDASGLGYWTGQLSAGLPRNIAMYGFLFATEFNDFMTTLFGNTSSRAEVYAVVDYYRGILNRLPDDVGFVSWRTQFRTAQCAGAGPIYAAVDSISTLFIYSGEYLARNRTNTEYVSDLYYAFLRRGGDLAGVQYWINQLNSGIQTREQLRQAFINTPEFSNRVNAIIAQGCYAGP
jgi:hypothetical protein